MTAARKIEIKLARSTNQELRSYYYDWNNAIFIKVGDAWKKSNSGWIGQAERVKKSLKGRSQAQVDKFVGYYISLFFRTRPKELVMMNSDNYSTLTDAEKKFVEMTFYSNGRFSIHWPGYPLNIYVPAESDFHLKQSSNFLSSFSYQGVIETGKGVGVGLDPFVDMPFNKLHGYRIDKSQRNLTVANCLKIDENWALNKKIYEKDTDYWLKTPAFTGDAYEKTITTAEMGDLEKFNNYKKQVDDVDPSNVEKSDLILAPEYAFFLYDNKNIIKETFISEINKKVSLIGSLWYFVKAGSNGRMNLVNSRNKLNFKIKKSQNLAKFNFGISPVVVSKKINFKNRQINNIL